MQVKKVLISTKISRIRTEKSNTAETNILQLILNGPKHSRSCGHCLILLCMLGRLWKLTQCFKEAWPHKVSTRSRATVSTVAGGAVIPRDSVSEWRLTIQVHSDHSPLHLGRDYHLCGSSEKRPFWFWFPTKQRHGDTNVECYCYHHPVTGRSEWWRRRQGWPLVFRSSARLT